VGEDLFSNHLTSGVQFLCGYDYWCTQSELGQLQLDHFQTEVEADFIVIS
jgi:hypothetical protein